MEVGTIAIIILGIVVIVLIGLLLTRRSPDYRHSFTLLQQQVGQVEEQVKRRVDEGSKAVGEKFENSLKVIGDIKKTIGSLEVTNKQMLDIGKNISSLQDLLKPPQIRGGFGELTLGQILKTVLPRQNFDEQHRFKNGSIVDAVVRIGDKLVPIDSKFPLESFQRYIECPEEAKRSHLKEFERNIKAKIDDISSKYILEDEGTYGFALMYIPSENVYYQTILKDDLRIEERTISDYAMEKQVIVVSPNSIYAYLNVICFGLRGMEVEKNVRKIMDDFSRLNKEFAKFKQHFGTLGGHLGHAKNTFDVADQQLGTFSSRLSLIRESPEVEAIEEAQESEIEGG
ncbi:DNA recombination protein RmuC [Chloroflexota bacterium]